jgi:hypothetical protein
LKVYVSDSNEPSHDVSEKRTLPVHCQKPKPVWDLMAREKLSELGTPLGLYHNSFPSALEITLI